jgi:hypothetical protein
VKIPASVGFKTSLIFILSGILVIKRSSTLFSLVGMLLICSKKKSSKISIYFVSFTPTEISREFQHARGKLKSPARTIFE